MPVYDSARERYAEVGVDSERAIEKLAKIPISLHCWQGDDVGGFEGIGGQLGGGLAVTGNYLGKARTPYELRQDLEKALSLIPGKHRLNLHAMYGEFGASKVDRDAVESKHFENWISWCKSQGLGFDFNPTCFSHSKAADGFTLSHQDKGIRDFWIEHCRRCREIGEYAGKQLASPCIVNVWIPDGMKDTPADRRAPRDRLKDSLDQIFEKRLGNALDSVESKLFGIGSESYVVGSHEFYLAYAVKKQILVCLDSGHYHPTESIADKISACLLFLPEILLHVSRGVRWDSDHVVTMNDDLQAIAREIISNGFEDRVHIGLDYFDASINRVAAWVIGTRNMQKALLIALLEPTVKLQQLEIEGNFTARLAVQEEVKSLPWGVVWDEFCNRHNTAPNWLDEVHAYEKNVLAKR